MADTFSFDVVSDFDRQELVNAVDQSLREINTRYDLKDSASELKLDETTLTILTNNEMSLNAIQDILRGKASKRGLSQKIFDFGTPETAGGNKLRQVVTLQKGIESTLAKQISKLIRDTFKKVQASIQGDAVRVTAKSKDDLQSVMKLLKDQDYPLPLQFTNYR